VRTIRRKYLRLLLIYSDKKEGDEFLNHIVRATGDESWASFVNAETKGQSKQ
jgi:hypothetical protein